MTDRFKRLLDLEIEYQRLAKRRDELFAEEDSENSGFRLATVLSQIAKIERDIKEIRSNTVIVS